MCTLHYRENFQALIYTHIQKSEGVTGKVQEGKEEYGNKNHG